MRRTQEPRVEDTTRWGAGVAAVLLLYAAAGACRDNPTQPPAPDPNEVRATIGAAGGTLASRDGNVTITFPAGALASTRELTIRPIAAGELGAEFAGVEVARAYELGPTGLAFQSPATVTLRTDQQARQADGTLRLVPHILLTSRNGVVERLDDLSVVMSGDSVLARGRLTHFSPLVEQKTQQPIGWFEITGIPDQLEVGLVATIQARASIPVLDVTTAEYHDAAVDSPLRTAFPLMALLEADAGMYRRSIAYACEQTGEGIFQAYVQIVTSGNQNGDVAPWLRSATLRGDVRKATACIPAAIFTLTVNLSGGGTGSVTSVTNPPRTPPDISCPGNCNGNFTRGTLVGLAATPAAGSRFVGWSGACSGADPLGTVVVDDNRTCVAQFEATPRHTLTVTTSGDGAGTILKFPAGTGTDCGSNCAEYFEGATVLVSADHDANSVFAGWSGDCTGESTTTVVMNADKACTARFARVERTLTVTVAPEGTGRGTVATSPPGGIDCGADCSEQYPHGTAVALVAVPDENSVFAGWSGACSGSGPAVVTMDADKTCTARFDPKPRTLTVTKTGGGSGVVASTPAGIECGNDCTEQYPHGTGVALLATPDEGSIFVAWSGACPGGSGTTTVVMDADKSCSAQFDLIARTLTVTTTGDGAGSVGSFPPGIACGSGSTDCTEQYPHGTSVTLAAAAGDGSVFAGWSGACSGSGLTATVTMDADKSCTARFDRVKFSLRIATDGDGRGSVASAPAGIACGAGGTGCAALFDPGTSVTLTATAASGSRFVAWAGDGCTGSAPATTVAMTADRNCTATFALVRYTLGAERTGTGSGRVTSDPAGIDCGTACSADLLQGARVVLTAAADDGSYFAVWTGDCSGSSPNAFVTMDADRICSARFELLSARRLTVAISGSGQGSVSGGDALSLVSCPGGDCTALFPPGATVRLQAVAGAGSRFEGWSGDCSGTDPATTVVMTADRSCTARFEREPARRLLVVRTGSGTGRVTGTPAGDPGAVDCGQLCTVVYDRSTLVTLTAVPDENSVFAGWSGACSGSAATTDVLVEAADYSCTARFELELRTLTARAGGTGTGSVASAPVGIACGDDCTEQYPHGTTVRLTATPDAGSAFVGWTGDCVGSEPGTLVTMDADKACTALFTSAKFTLTVQPTGDGRGGVTSGPAGIACGDAGQDCAELYPEGTTVTLTAQPGASSVFVEWGGACAGEVVTVTVFMNANKTCTAEFRVGVDTVLVFKSGSGKGTVTSNPPGIDCGPDCDYQYEGYVKGTVVTLTAAPAQGSRFVEWSGDCVANGATATVTLDGHDRACTARFDSALPKTLTVVPTGSGSGSVSSLPLGISCGNVCASLFEDGSRVDLTALPVTGSRFVSWGNACSGSEPFASVTMDADKTCSARFDLIAYTLRVTTVGSATGTVTSAPPGIVCGAGGSDCAEPYAYRTAVTLTATPGPNARFTGWSGDCSGSDAATGVLMDADRACTAQFDLVLHTLAVTWGGSGSGRVASAPGGIDCGNDCAEQFVHGTTVALTALPDEGSTFTGWTGDCVGTAPGTLVTLDADRGCTALFDRVSFRLTVARAGAGAGSVVSAPAGIECGNVCSAPYAPGTPVTLVATPAQGSAFTGWSGSCSGSAPAAAVTMNADLACTAEFNVATYQLTVTVSGSGAGGVASAPEGIGCGNGAQDCEETYLYQTTVTLTATPAPGSMFGEWSGACAGSAPVATVAMDAARTCDARFDPATRTLTVGFTGGGSGQVASAPPGIDCRPGGPASVCTSSFDYGATVTLTAVPATGSSFVQWSADCVGSAPATTVAMDANRICLAQFEVITYTLRVTRVGSADGSVTSDPAGIGCGNACSAEYAHGTTVTLTAAPAENAVFTTWRVGCVGTAPGTTVTLTANTDCEAQFDLALRALTVTKSGAGGGRVTSAPGGVDCGSDCAEPYAHGTTVVLTAVPDENSFFLGWSGACAGSAPAASVTMDADKACDAQFDKLALRRLSLTKSGDGALAGTVTSTPPGITCGSICAADFPQGAQVTLTGSPAAPAFASWSGNAAGCSGTSPSVTVTLGAADATCDARFNRTITATVSTAGTGTGTIRTSNGQINCPDICTGIFAASTIIAFTATPAPGSMFTGWSGGNCFGTSTTATVFASAPVTCTATFTSTVGMTLRLLSSRDYGERVEAATLGVGSFLISSGEDGAGTLTSINFSNPSSPFVTASVPDYCFGAQSLFMLQQTTNSFMATSPGTGLGCVNKLAPAQTTLVDFGFTPGSGALIPGSSPNVAAGYAVADVGGGALEVRLTGQAPLRIPLAGTPRSCPWDVLVTSLLYLVVGREGVAGTPTEGCGSRGQLYIVNRSTSQVTGTVELGAAPRGIILSPDRLSAYIADAAEDRVYVVNLNARTVSRTIDVGDGPTSVALFPDGSHMVVTNRSTNRVQIVDVRTGAVMGDAPSNGSRPARVFITPDGGCVVVLNYGADGGAGNASFFAPQFSTAGTISAASARH